MKIDENTGRRVIRVLGPGGYEFDIDDPRDVDRPTRRDEVMLEQLEKRQVEIIDEYLDDDEAQHTSPPAPLGDSSGDDGGATPDPAPLEEPHRGASTAAWVDYAVSKGADLQDVENLKRDELVERFGTPTA